MEAIKDDDEFEWLDPFSESSEPKLRPPKVEPGILSIAGSRVLSEPLVAQRLITAGQGGLLLADRTEAISAAIPIWGNGLATAVATLIPSPEEGRDSDQKIRRDRRRLQEQFLSSQSKWPDLGSIGKTAFLICADHKPPEYGLPRQLYPQHLHASLVDRSSFSLLLDQLIAAVSPETRLVWEDARTALREGLTTIVYETFKNTHDHARTEFNGADVRTSIRGLFAKFYAIEELGEGNPVGETDYQTPPETYMRNLFPRQSAPGLRAKAIPTIRGFLELSVLDSGPGMAARWKGVAGDTMNPSEQLDMVLNCIRKGQSSTGSNGRGYGLWRVLQALEQLRGFMSIRTNAVHAFRQFAHTIDIGKSELPGGLFVPKERLLDWKRGVSTSPSSYPGVKGTVVSFLLPVGRA